MTTAQIVSEEQMKKPLELLVSAREVEETELRKALTIINPKFEEANQRDYELRLAIKEGRATTDNPYRDFFIVHYAGEEILSDKYKKLEAVDSKANASESRLMLIADTEESDIILVQLIKYEKPLLILDLEQGASLEPRLGKNYRIYNPRELDEPAPLSRGAHVRINAVRYLDTSIKNDEEESKYSTWDHEAFMPRKGNLGVSLSRFIDEQTLFLIGEKEIRDFFSGKGCENDYNRMIKSLEKAA